MTTAKRARAEFLDGYLDILADVSRTGRRLARHELAERRRLGALAARSGAPLSVVVDRYLGATRRAWAELSAASGTHALAASVLCAVNDAVVALAEGYGDAQRAAIRAEEAARHEFVDDLLRGAEPGRLAERAGRYGLQLTQAHLVVVAGAPDRPIDVDGTLAEAVRRRFGEAGRALLVTTVDGLLVCIAAKADADLLADHLQATVDNAAADNAAADNAAVDNAAAAGKTARGRIGVGRAHPGPGGVARSFAEARAALELGHRLGLPPRQPQGADLLVFQVLVRDRAAMVDLVATALEPLRQARGGPRPLLDTLAVYFAAGSAAAAARQLHLSVRALTYRLARVHQLTGYDPTDPVQRYTLETAVLGARMLNWPAAPLPTPN